MRLVPAVSIAVVVAAAALVLPVTSVTMGPAAAPVAPKVERVAIPAPATSMEADGLPVVGSIARVVPRGTDIMGVSFAAPLPPRLVILVRTEVDGSWSPWTRLPMTDLAPDPGTTEAERARIGTEPLGVEGVGRVEIRVASPSGAPRALRADFINAGRSAADASVGSKPASAAVAAAVKPTIYTRAAWGADESLRNCGPEYASKIQGGVVHHTVNSNSYAEPDVPALIRGIYAYHTQTLGWCDIGYNFIVDRFGRIFEGRYGGDYRNVVGAHTQGFNSQTVGVASLGDHTSTEAPSATRTAIGRLIGWKAWLNSFDPRGSVSYTSAGNPTYPAGTEITRPRAAGHRDFYATECPGDKLYARLSEIRTTAGATYDTGAVPAPSPQPQTYARPKGTSIAFAGRGHGHGRGMSQWGAYGAATKGLTWQQIVAFYYPGTSLAALGNPQMRLQLTAIGTTGVQAVWSSGLKVTDGSRTISLSGTTSSGAVVDRWRVVRDGLGLTLQWRSGGTWYTSTAWKAVTTPLSFLHASGKVRVVIPGGHLRDYRGQIRTHVNGAAAMTVNVVPLQSYLQGVVAAEMPASWSPAALQAQSVAARTYAAYQKAHQPAGSLFDTCDSTSCQVYKGVAEYYSSGSLYRTYEDSRTTSAASATNGYAVYYNGAPALTEFSASNGGVTVGSSLPYQPVKSDPYDGVVSGSPNRWTASLAITTIEQSYPTTGTLKALQIGQRTGSGDWGGRMSSVTIVGSSGSQTVTGEAFRLKVGLRSNWWAMTSAPARSTPAHPKDLTSDQLADLVAIDPDGSLRVLQGDGSSGFTAIMAGSGWGTAGLVTSVGPWDSDNRGDVLARGTTDGVLYYYRGSGTGTLQQRVMISSGWSLVDLLVGTGDFNGDGYNDFLARRSDDGRLVLCKGNGAGGVAGTATISSGWGQFRLVIAPGDVDGDNRPDVLALRTSDQAMLLYSGTGSGGLLAPVPVAGDWAGFSAIVGAGDVTSDGRNDLVGRRSSDGALVVLPGDAMGGFSAGTVVGTAWASWSRWLP